MKEDIMGRIGMPELIVIAVVVILLFGAKKLPEIGAAVGRAIKEFRQAGKEIEKDVNDTVEEKKSDSV